MGTLPYMGGSDSVLSPKLGTVRMPKTNHQGRGG